MLPASLDIRIGSTVIMPIVDELAAFLPTIAELAAFLPAIAELVAFLPRIAELVAPCPTIAELICKFKKISFMTPAALWLHYLRMMRQCQRTLQEILNMF